MHIFLFLFTSQLHFSENKGVRSTRAQSESLRECYGECELVFNTEELVDYEEELQSLLMEILTVCNGSQFHLCSSFIVS